MRFVVERYIKSGRRDGDGSALRRATAVITEAVHAAAALSVTAEPQDAGEVILGYDNGRRAYAALPDSRGQYPFRFAEPAHGRGKRFAANWRRALRRKGVQL